MTPNALLIAARNAGLALKVESGILRVRGPHSALATWAPRLKAHKPELIALLEPPPPADLPEEEDPGTAFYAALFTGRGPRCYVTLTPEDIHRAVVAGLLPPAEARGAVLLAIKSPAGFALLTIPNRDWDPFKALAACDPVTLH
ncbi:MAG: hypothetical protein IT487_04045 [Chromatiaceae bacterium]|nr:hypothetical protein [Chromatiaceae bacterium]